MHIHILGICGTFMGGLALLASARGHRVTGSDENVYPPMSTQLEQAGIGLMKGYDPAHLRPAPDMVVIGNALSRGNAAIEYLLAEGLAYTSGPQWLAQHVLYDKWVVAVAGTHGKTSTSALLAWILEYAGLQPGFLIGGVPENFGVSARYTESPFFVVEADEYDTAFFDKRSKFVHYHPRTLIMNNLEFDHADIFDDLGQIQRQFHHLVRTVPGNGLIVMPGDDVNLANVIDRGCWTPVETFALEKTGYNWQARLLSDDGSEFAVLLEDQQLARARWSLMGRHNVSNAIAAIAAARHAGVPAAISIEALSEFANVKRRMQLRGEINGIHVYDDFAHHPTAIQTTLDGLRQRVGSSRIIAVLEPRSNSMKMGVHAALLADALADADHVMVFAGVDVNWDPARVFAALGDKAKVFNETDDIINALCELAQPNDHVLIMSNGGFENIHQRLLDRLQTIQ